MRQWIFLLAVLALGACTAPNLGTPSEDANRTASGALALFAPLDEAAGTGENVVYSPASVDQAFGLLRLGAAGETANQLDAVLPAPSNADYLRTNGRDVEVRIANALFLSSDFNFRQAFVSEAKSRYDATAQRVDFTRPQPAADAINDWAKKETEGLIDSVITPGAINDEMITLLANALYFDGKWEDRLSGGDRRNFLFGDGGDKPFAFVGRTGEYMLVEKGNWTAVRIPYRNTRYAMDVLIPTRRRVMDEASDVSRIEALGTALGDAAPQLVELRIPQFEVDYATGLIQPLKALGLTAPFTDGVADLSLLAATGQRNLVVSDARHVTKLQVFDEGTRAAAVTTISIVQTGARIVEEKPKSFIADRPFIIVIRDLEAKEVLFLGRISDPQPFEPEVVEPGR